jgi:O-succinylhomoserine sulfhydrylase
MAEQRDFETGAIRDQLPRTAFREHSAPIFATSSFIFPDAQEMAEAFSGQGEGLIYSRYSNPNTDELVGKLRAMEGTEDGFAAASGMAAVFASMAAFLRAGDHLLASRALFGSTIQILNQLLPRWGIACSYIDPVDVDSWAGALRPTTRMLVLESPSNPGLDLVDLARAGAFARAHGLLFNIDNCFATPYLQQPARYGADLIVHSATKWLDGQGRVLGGVVLGSARFIEEVRFFCRHTGPALSPFNAWVLSKSLETLAVRMERHCANALTLAHWLEAQTPVRQVRYPFLSSHPQHQLAKAQMRLGGGVVSFELAGGEAAAMAFLNRLRLCSLSANLGDTRTILTHPASTTHSKLSEEERREVGITPGLLRISAGLERVEDIQDDLRQAMRDLPA